MKGKLKKLIDIITSEGLKSDFDKFFDNNVDAAATRVRKAMQEIKCIAQEVREGVQDVRNKNK